MSIEPVANDLRIVLMAFEDALQRNPEARGVVQRWAAYLTEISRESEPSSSAPTSAPAPSVFKPAVISGPTPSVRTEALPLRIGGMEVPISVAGTYDDLAAARQSAGSAPDGAPRPVEIRAERAVPDLRLVAQRCRIKAEGCRLSLEKRERLRQGQMNIDDLEDRRHELVARGKALPNCFIWATYPLLTLPGDALMEDIEACYDNLADIAELAHDICVDSPSDFGLRAETYLLLAEAQSALRVGIYQANIKPDQDQNDTFHWLRQRTYEDHVFVPRFMQLEDPADPSNHQDIADRIADLGERFELEATRARRHRAVLSKARYHADLIARERSVDAGADWRSLIGALEELFQQGMLPSDRQFREILAPIVDAMPDDVEIPEGVELILREVDRVLAQEEESDPQEPAARAPSREVQEVAELLRGRTVLMIGGEARPQSRQALEEAFGLRELIWENTVEHQSIAPFESGIARPETALVLLAIRWASHSFEGVKEMCQRHGKPFVRLPRGYNANQVAAEVLAQVSEQLRRMQPASV